MQLSVRPPLMPITDAEHKALGLAPDLHPLSANQEQMLVLYSLDKQSSVYNVPMELTTPPGTVLDVQVVRRCVDALVMRHASLRTHIVDDAETKQAMQRVCPACDFDVSLEVMNENDKGDDAAVNSVDTFVSRVGEAAFDLYAGPWVRFGLAHATARDCSTLVIAMHHIAGDGWSLGSLPSELSAMYEAARDDTSLSTHTLANLPSLPELTVQYTDYAHWQHRVLAQVSDGQLEYWHDQLGANGGPAPLDLPTDRPRPKRQTFNGAYVNLSVPSDIVTQLRTLGNAHGASLYMTLLGAYQLLLSRYSRQEEVCVGSPYAGRDEAATQHIMGYMVNTLAMKCDMSGGEDVSFVDVLGRVRATVLGAFGNADVPFHHVVDALKVSRDASRTPVYQVMFALQPLDPIAASFTARVVIGATAMFDSMLELMPDGTDSAQLIGTLRYNTDLFDRDTAQRMASQYVQLLRSIARHPTAPIGSLSMMSEQDLHLVRDVLPTSGGESDVPNANEPLHSLFEASAKRTPSATALVTLAETLTYSELNRRANRLARVLRDEYGVGADVCVGLCAEKSAAMLVGMLGILKAGGAYVPLDPEYPDQRVITIVEDSGASVVLVQDGVCSWSDGSSLDLGGGASVLALTEAGDGSAASFGAVSAADDVNLEWVSGGGSFMPCAVYVWVNWEA